jgi:hypothetical protein
MATKKTASVVGSTEPQAPVVTRVGSGQIPRYDFSDPNSRKINTGTAQKDRPARASEK